ncbi:MAG: ribosome-associated translation inhibitor RaiA [Armatimonadota bacterium]
MQVTIKGKNIDLTESLKDYATKKIEKISRYFDQIASADITFSTERQMHIIEVNIHVNGEILRGEEKTGDMYGSVDKVIDKLEKQIKKRKEKNSNKKHKVKSLKEVPLKAEEAYYEEGSNELDPQILKVKRFDLGKPMTVSEAIKESEALGYDFFVFLNAENLRVNVVYERKQGFGLIDPVV